MAAPRGPGFSEDETAALLDVIEDILPNCPNDWERVTEAHRISFPDLKRTTKSLKRKFEALYNHKKPTGDPTCPVIVRRAKQIWEDMRRSMDFSDAEGEISFDGDAPLLLAFQSQKLPHLHQQLRLLHPSQQSPN